MPSGRLLWVVAPVRSSACRLCRQVLGPTGNLHGLAGQPSALSHAATAQPLLIPEPVAGLTLAAVVMTDHGRDSVHCSLGLRGKSSAILFSVCISDWSCTLRSVILQPHASALSHISRHCCNVLTPFAMRACWSTFNTP